MVVHEWLSPNHFLVNMSLYGNLVIYRIRNVTLCSKVIFTKITCRVYMHLHWICVTCHCKSMQVHIGLSHSGPSEVPEVIANGNEGSQPSQYSQTSLDLFSQPLFSSQSQHSPGVGTQMNRHDLCVLFTMGACDHVVLLECLVISYLFFSYSWDEIKNCINQCFP